MVQRSANLVKKTVGTFTSGSLYPKVLINGTTGAYTVVKNSSDEASILTPLVGVNNSWVVWEPDAAPSVTVNGTTYPLTFGTDFDTMVYLDKTGPSNVVHEAIGNPVLTATWNTPTAGASNLSWTNTYLSPTYIYRTAPYTTFASVPVSNVTGASAANNATTTVYSYNATSTGEISVAYSLTASGVPSAAGSVQLLRGTTPITNTGGALPRDTNTHSFTDRISVTSGDVINISVTNGDTLGTITYAASAITIKLYAVAPSVYVLIAQVDGPTIPGAPATYADAASGVSSGNSVTYMVMNANGTSASAYVDVP